MRGWRCWCAAAVVWMGLAGGVNSAFAGGLCDGLAGGRFAGSWCSEGTGHQGRMCARLKQVDACTYRARFTGTFLKVIPFTYSVPLQVAGQGADGSVWLTGQSRLPIFGDFTTQARVDACGVQATYHSPKDHGTFTMQRR